jgi:hypothetical protein
MTTRDGWQWLDTLEPREFLTEDASGHLVGSGSYETLLECALAYERGRLGYDVNSLEEPFWERDARFRKDHPALVAEITRECQRRTLRVIDGGLPPEPPDPPAA